MFRYDCWDVAITLTVVPILASLALLGCGGMVESTGSGGVTPDAGVDGTSGSGGAGGSGGSGGTGGTSTGSTGGTAGGAGSGGTGGSTGEGTDGGCTGCGTLEECWSGYLCVAKLVGLPAGYSIDATEVTASQYAAWLATKPAVPPSTPGNVCSWKASYNESVGEGDHPIAVVDWCDAYAYCRGVGKRLCGKIGGGAANYHFGFNDATQDQWFNACSSGGVYSYPYGDMYQPKACNGIDHGSASVAVGSMKDCESSVSGYTGVYDLSGNVYEWVDACSGNAGKEDLCLLRGGAFGIDVKYLTCAYHMTNYRYNGNYTMGFRCCSDP